MDRRTLRVLAIGALAAWLAGCGSGSGSDVGSQPKTGPIAVAKALNQPFTGNPDSIRVTARAGSEVFLSGKDSDGTVVPVMRYEWSATNAAAQAVKLLKRTESTVSFTAPMSATATSLQFQLRVVDSNGATDDATVTVDVVPVLDPDLFLSYNDAQTYTIVAVTDQVAALAADLPFTISVERRLSYTDLVGQRHENFPLGTTTLDGTWLAAYGTGGTGADCGSELNPRFTVPLPALDMDDVLAAIPGDAPQRAVDPATIDDAELTVRIRLTPLAAVPAGVQTGVCVLGTGAAAAAASAKPLRSLASFATAHDGVSAEHIVSLEELLGTPGPQGDTAASAEAYYRTIDPPDAYEAKKRLSGWLRAAGLSNGATDWQTMRSNASAHAVYLNNYDLGFGRDMYMKVGACDDGAAPALGGTLPPERIGKCDVYGVVINYSSLEGAAKAIGPILAVAMEYTAAPASNGRRVTKFYAYAPDRQGDFRRVLSVNLDGRGEKYVPQSCVVCHGGAPLGLDPSDSTLYANGGDLDSGFLSWDLDSFLFSDTDPAFSKPSDPNFSPEERELTERYSRSAQQAALKKLNQLAYLTMANPAPTGTPPARQRFDLARDLLEGWYGGPGLPAASFNGAYVPTGWKNGADGNPADAEKIYKDVFAQNCRACHVLHVPEGVSGQRAMGSYAEFFDSANLAALLGNGQMPFARMTMDRLWTTSAGAVLQEHMVDRGKGYAKPGTKELRICESTLRPDRGSTVRLDASCSRYVGQYQWTVTAPGGQTVPLVGANTPTPVFVATAEGIYSATLSDGSGGSASATAEVPKSVPQAGSTEMPLAKVLPASGVLTFDIDVFDDLVGTASRDDISTLRITSTQGLASAVPSPDAPTRKVRVTASSLAAGVSSFSYSLEDIDGDVSPADGLVEINVGAELELASTTLRVDVNGQSSVNLANLVSKAPAGQPLAFRVTVPPTLQRSRGNGSATVNGSMLSYLAPKGVATEVKSSGLKFEPSVQDTFGVQAYFVNRPTVTADSTLKADLLAQTLFAEVAADVRNRCSTCHEAQQVGSLFVVKPTDSDPTVWCAITSGRTLSTDPIEPDDAPYANLTSPADSIIYGKVRGQFAHGGGNLASQGFNAARLLAWLDEGGYLTSSASVQVCQDQEPPANIGPPAAGSSSKTISWVDQNNNWTDVDVSTLPGIENAVVISDADLRAEGEVSVVRTGSLTIRIALKSLQGAPNQVGTVRYKVKNLKGELSSEGSIAVFGTAPKPQLKTASFTAKVGVNSSDQQVVAGPGGIDKVGSTPSGLGVECRLTSGPSLNQNPLAGNGRATANVNCASARYTPPPRTQTVFGTSRFAPADNLGYRICYTGSQICSDEVTVTVDVEGQSAFPGGDFAPASCGSSSCHSPASTSPTASAAWVVGATDKATWCSIRNSPRPTVLTVANPAGSNIYLVPRDGKIIGTQDHASYRNAALATAVLAWIQEGAYFTGAGNQACP